MIYQAGPYNPNRLNHHRTDEPFPVKVTPRNEQHVGLILDEAALLQVLDDAKRRI